MFLPLRRACGRRERVPQNARTRRIRGFVSGLLTVMFVGCATALFIFLMDTASAGNSDIWGQVSGNATIGTATNTDCSVNYPTSTECGDATWEAGNTYFWVGGMREDEADATPAFSGARVQTGTNGCVGIQCTLFGIRKDGTFKAGTGLAAHGSLVLEYHTNASSVTCGVFTCVHWWAVVRFVPLTDLPMVTFQQGDTTGGGQDRMLRGWTEDDPPLEQLVTEYIETDATPDDTVGYAFLLPPEPDAPVLTCVASERDALLTWTTPGAGFPIQGYNITKNPSGETVHLGLVNAYTWENALSTRNRTFTIHAWNQAGNGPTDTCSLRVEAGTLAGENGIVYGGDRAELATALRVSPGALDVLIASLIIVIMLTAGAFIAGSNGAIVGGILGIGIDTMLSLIPIWLIALILAVVGAIFLLTRGGTTR